MTDSLQHSTAESQRSFPQSPKQIWWLRMFTFLPPHPADSLTGKCRSPRSRAPSFPSAGPLVRSLHRHTSGGQCVTGAFTKRLTVTSGHGVSLSTGLPSASATGPGELRYSRGHRAGKQQSQGPPGPAAWSPGRCAAPPCSSCLFPGSKHPSRRLSKHTSL